MARKKKVSISEELETLIDGLVEAQYDAIKFDKGNKAAGTRVRKALQVARKQCQELRVTIQDIKNSM